MEQPYKGRATINDNITDVEVIVPSKKNWLLIIFMFAWLLGWCAGEIAAIVGATGLSNGHPANLFLLVWLVGWTVGGFFVIKILLWNINGKELIKIGQGILTISRKGSLFFKSKTYDLNEVKRIRIQDDDDGYTGPFGGRRSSFMILNSGGTIRFDYGLQTIRFAIALDEAEAKFIVDKLRERRLLTDKNFN